MSLDKLFSCEIKEIDPNNISDKDLNLIEIFSRHLQSTNQFKNILGESIANPLMKRIYASKTSFYFIVDSRNKFNKSNFEDILTEWNDMNSLDTDVKAKFLKLKYRGQLQVYLKLFKEDESR